MLYKPGDEVIVRSDLQVDHRYYMDDNMTHDVFVSSMAQFRGKIVTIESVINVGNSYKYLITEGACNWTDEMFKGLAYEECPVKITKDQINALI